MKRVVILVLLALLPFQSHALDLDKKRHILASILTFSTAYAITGDIKTSVIFGMSVGLAKESFDSTSPRGDGFDTHDLAADALGVGLGFIWVKRF